MSTQTFFASPEDCARAFYEAVSHAELNALMAVWSEDEDICCVHPMAAPLHGYSAVRASWEAIFRSGTRMRIELREEHWTNTIGMCIQTAVEWFFVGDESSARGPVCVSNVYLRTPQGWRMLSHHVSVIQTGLTHGANTTVMH